MMRIAARSNLAGAPCAACVTDAVLLVGALHRLDMKAVGRDWLRGCAGGELRDQRCDLSGGGVDVAPVGRELRLFDAGDRHAEAWRAALVEEQQHALFLGFARAEGSLRVVRFPHPDANIAQIALGELRYD